MSSDQPDERAQAWLEGYADGLLEGWQTPVAFDVTLCTCTVMAGGARSPNADCEIHSHDR